MGQVKITTSRTRFSSKCIRWFFLIGISVFLVWIMTVCHIPAGWMIGPMLAGIIFAVINIRLKVNRWGYHGSQAVIGCLIATSLTQNILHEMIKDWPLFLLVIGVVMILSWGLGLVLAKWNVIPPDVAIWGASPGAASAMVIMAKAFGSDERLVACMQYIRVLLVVLVASVVASIVTGSGSMTHSLFEGWAVLPDGWNLSMTLLLIVGGVILGHIARIPAGSMLVPMLLGTFLHLMGWIVIDLPEVLLVLSYSLIGWQIGLGFDRDILRTSLKALPRIVFSNLILIALCGILGMGVSYWFHVDPLSAYLATSPGGANTVAVIALSTPVDVAFIMALQTCRLMIIILTGPWISQSLMKFRKHRDV
ncbi:AbrB family transcriptional regulator [Celerinatantimonas sp. YJH-8]|uniref:AbrB family transcriptional regulator n=1 Tax=Celerinatantimonas sp. YJH-8 TaxID=3228714 RepID=UPI0038C5FE5A